MDAAAAPTVIEPVGEALRSSTTVGDTVSDRVYARAVTLAEIVVSAALEAFIGTKMDDTRNVAMNATQKIGIAEKNNLG